MISVLLRSLGDIAQKALIWEPGELDRPESSAKCHLL